MTRESPLASVWQAFGKRLASVWQAFGKRLASLDGISAEAARGLDGISHKVILDHHQPSLVYLPSNTFLVRACAASVVCWETCNLNVVLVHKGPSRHGCRVFGSSFELRLEMKAP